MRHGFSLVELSIVLVILGLLTGGILAGQSLIRAAELRSVSTDYNRYLAATQTFRDKYFALPGDMTNAQSFWGVDSAGCPNGGGASGTCNGNGSGTINSTISNQCENQEFWRHLSLAGLIEGKYTPKTTAGCFSAVTPGQDAPSLRVSNSAITISYMGPISSNAAFPGNVIWIGNYQNLFFLGGASSTINGMAGGGGMLKPEEQWNIDTKMDDGLPATGALLSIYPGVYAPAAGTSGCVTTNVASTTAYSLTNSALTCSMVIKPGF